MNIYINFYTFAVELSIYDMGKTSDIYLLERLQQGDEHALNQLYNLFFHALCAYSNRFIQEEAQCADIVQEVFVKVWYMRKKFNSIYALRSFMYISVRNACLNYNRNSTKIAKISLSDNISEINIEDTCLIIEEEVHRLIQNEIDRLPDAMKQIFNLTLAEMSVKEIAQTLHISENTVRNQRTKARKILRNNLKDKIFLLFL